jgi:hypothetical protein
VIIYLKQIGYLVDISFQYISIFLNDMTILIFHKPGVIRVIKHKHVWRVK